MTTAPTQPRVRRTVRGSSLTDDVPAVSHPWVETVGVASTPEARDALLATVTAARRLVDADRAALLLFDTVGAVAPVVSVGRSSDGSVWTQARPLILASLGAVTDAVDVLSAGRPLGVEDAAACPWIPATLRESYSFASLAVAPLVGGDGLLGALVAYSVLPRAYVDAELDALGCVAASAASAVELALGVTAERAAIGARDALLANVPLLYRARDRDEVLGCALTAAAEILRGASRCVGLVTATGDVTLVPDVAPVVSRCLDDLGAGVAATFDRALSNTTGVAVVLPADALAPWTGRQQRSITGLAVVPFGDVGGARAFAVVGCLAGAGAGTAALAVAGRLREHVGAAVARVEDTAGLVRRVQHLEVLYQLAEDVALSPDIHVVVERLAPAVRAATCAELIDVFLCDTAASKLFGTHTARGTLAQLMARWRRSPRARVAYDAGLLVIPMLLDGALVGVVRVRPLLGRDLGPAEEHLLQTIADGLGEMVSRTVLRDRVAASERELAVADERERIARDLHDTLGQMHFAVRAEIGSLAETTPDEVLSTRLKALEQVVSRADTELRQAINALSFLGRGNHGLVPSIRSLVRRTRDQQSLDVSLKLVGTPVPLPPDQEEALYRLTREALTNAARHARAALATVTVRFEPDKVAVDVRDDGTGLLARPAGEQGLHFGLRSMQRRLADVGGGLEVRNRRPRGVTVSGWVPGA